MSRGGAPQGNLTPPATWPPPTPCACCQALVRQEEERESGPLSHLLSRPTGLASFSLPVAAGKYAGNGN
eukprot:236080-Pleurochrysis_carterae.AAC.2